MAGRSPDQPHKQTRHLRLLHLMALIAAVAVTLVVAPALMQAIMWAHGPAASWNRRMYLDGVASITLTVWTFSLAWVGVSANRSRLRRACRSHGTAMVLAAATGLCVLFFGEALSSFLVLLNGGLFLGDITLELTLQKLNQALDDVPRISAASIGAVRVILALTRAGRKPSGWFELLNMLFGLIWVIWFLVRPLLYYARVPWLDGDPFTW